jgi:hypothetical protein
LSATSNGEQKPVPETSVGSAATVMVENISNPAKKRGTYEQVCRVLQSDMGDEKKDIEVHILDMS